MSRSNDSVSPPGWNNTKDLPKAKRKYTKHRKETELTDGSEKVEVLLNKRQGLEIIIRILQKELEE